MTSATHTCKKSIRSGRRGTLLLAKKGQVLENVEHMTFGGADFVKFSVGRNVNGAPVFFEIPTMQALECIEGFRPSASR